MSSDAKVIGNIPMSGVLDIGVVILALIGIFKIPHDILILMASSYFETKENIKKLYPFMKGL